MKYFSIAALSLFGLVCILLLQEFTGNSLTAMVLIFVGAYIIQRRKEHAELDIQEENPPEELDAQIASDEESTAKKTYTYARPFKMLIDKFRSKMPVFFSKVESLRSISSELLFAYGLFFLLGVLAASFLGKSDFDKCISEVSSARTSEAARLITLECRRMRYE